MVSAARQRRDVSGELLVQVAHHGVQLALGVRSLEKPRPGGRVGGCFDGKAGAHVLESVVLGLLGVHFVAVLLHVTGKAGHDLRRVVIVDRGKGDSGGLRRSRRGVHQCCNGVGGLSCVRSNLLGALGPL